MYRCLAAESSHAHIIGNRRPLAMIVNSLAAETDGKEGASMLKISIFAIPISNEHETVFP